MINRMKKKNKMERTKEIHKKDKIKDIMQQGELEVDKTKQL